MLADLQTDRLPKPKACKAANTLAGMLCSYVKLCFEAGPEQHEMRWSLEQLQEFTLSYQARPH